MFEFLEGYFVTESGEVFSNKMGGMKPRKLVKDSMGYYSFTVRINGKTCKRYLHRVVAECFVDNPDGHDVVNHKDGDKLNNHPSNLEWCSHLDNSHHAWATGLHNGKSENHCLSKLTNEEVRKAREDVSNGVKQTEIAARHGMCKAAVSAMINRKTYADVE